MDDTITIRWLGRPDQARQVSPPAELIRHTRAGLSAHAEQIIRRDQVHGDRLK